MWSVCGVLAVLAVLAVAARAHDDDPLHCRHERCRYFGSGIYEIDGRNVTFNYWPLYKQISMNCNGATVLESAALPRAEPKMHVNHVWLVACPLPANGSLADTLAALNVVLDYHYQRGSTEWWKDSSTITLYNLPSRPPLAAKHFTNLYFSWLRINGHIKQNLDYSFLAPVSGLRTLEISTEMPLPFCEEDFKWDILPSLERLVITDNNLKWLPEKHQSLSTQGEVDMSEKGPQDAVAVSMGKDDQQLSSPATSLRLESTHALDSLSIYGWTEPRPEPLKSCDSLQELVLEEAAMIALPDGWLAKCTRLRKLVIDQALHLTTLPSQLLVGPKDLIILRIRGGVLESLPAKLLDYVPRLLALRLNHNRLRTLPSDMFNVSHNVTGLVLDSNNLNVASLDVLAPLWMLEYLSLDDNPSLSSAGVCDPSHNGSLPLRMMNLTLKPPCLWTIPEQELEIEDGGDGTALFSSATSDYSIFLIIFLIIFLFFLLLLTLKIIIGKLGKPRSSEGHQLRPNQQQETLLQNSNSPSAVA